MSDRYYLFRGCLIPTRLPFLERSSLFVLDKLGVRYELMPGATCCVEPIGLRSLAEDTWLVVTARMLAIAEKDGRDILSLCNGCYLSLEEARQHLEDGSARDEVNTVLAEIGLHYDGNVKVKHFVRDRQRGGRGTDQVTGRSTSGTAQDRRPSGMPHGPAIVQAQDRLEASRRRCWMRSPPGAAQRLSSAKNGRNAAEGASPAWTRRSRPGCWRMPRPRSVRAEPNCILTPCPFCFVQFDIRQKEGLPVLYLSELLALAFGATPEQIGLKYHKTRLPWISTVARW